MVSFSNSAREYIRFSLKILKIVRNRSRRIWERYIKQGRRSPGITSFVGLYDEIELKLRSSSHNDHISISFCTTTKGRFEHLRETLPQNISDSESYPNCEFIVLDYNCPDERTRSWFSTEMLSHIESGKLKYFYFPDEPSYHMAHSRNLGFRVSTGEIVCNIDADNFIGAGFAEYLSTVMANKDVFLQGPNDGRDLLGRLCMQRHAWERVGGYDERLKNWGGEDIDLAYRLELINHKRKVIHINRFCQSISHSDELRTEFFDQSKNESRQAQWMIIRENQSLKTICPNGLDFGHGRVEKNFREWIDV